MLHKSSEDKEMLSLRSTLQGRVEATPSRPLFEFAGLHLTMHSIMQLSEL